MSMEQIKQLRERTGAGMLDVKNALQEAGGDEQKAIELLRQKGLATAEKKASRVTAEGVVKAWIAADNKAGVLLEMNCETDFVAKGETFQALTDYVLRQIQEGASETVDALLAQQDANHAGRTVEEAVKEVVGQVKENMTIRRFVRYQGQGSPSAVQSYIHMGGKMGVLVEVVASKPETTQAAAFQQLLKDLGLQIAGAASEYVSRAEVPAEVIDRETRVEMGKEDLANKPEAIRAKIVEGRVSKIVGQRVLLEQPFVKDPGKTIEDLLKEVSAQVGDTVTVSRFTRYVLGEGIDRNAEEADEKTPASVAG
ncbi:MAG: translation elongation factor Ts [Candidatus Melainabacteria bacterium]|nr:translation elongation factor Ts [Candidatus Melainabacteria bacterium]